MNVIPDGAPDTGLRGRGAGLRTARLPAGSLQLSGAVRLQPTDGALPGPGRPRRRPRPRPERRGEQGQTQPPTEGQGGR